MNPRLKKQRAIVEINITPFTDVILVLLVIFMITTPLMLQSGIKVNLPHAVSAKAFDTAGQISIIVTDKDLIYLNNLLITKNELKDKIGLMRKKDPDLKVVIFSDRLARFKDIVSVLDILNGEGVRSLNIAARIREP